MQPLRDLEATPTAAGKVQWHHTMNTLRTHARAVRHRRLRCHQVARVHGFDQPRVGVGARARAGCGGGRRRSTRCIHTCNWGGVASDLHAYWGSGAEQRTLRPLHETGHRAAKRLLVELMIASTPLQELRRGAAVVALEGGVGPDAAEPLRDVEATPEASVVQ